VARACASGAAQGQNPLAHVAERAGGHPPAKVVVVVVRVYAVGQCVETRNAWGYASCLCSPQYLRRCAPTIPEWVPSPAEREHDEICRVRKRLASP
jgi:hypothetical protein